jgi:DNA invertase Pin-like site-specific DNA recombinase/sulfur relay (sulfurtransferase) DsrF/TusC family protein
MSQIDKAPVFGHEKKISSRHQERLAVVYVRQSSLHQVQQNQESTQLQYNLVEHAERLGWPRERILVIDEDLGISGASSEGRLGFQRLLSEIALDHVGVILGIEMSRLARSCKDWYQLLELCALFSTLICDLDGLYDPTSYNDRLLLGLKGTMSEAELHILRQRMWQGALHKARRGELLHKGPIGYVRVDNQIVLDPDEQAQSVVRLVFDQFDRLGSMNAVLQYFVANGIRLPVRVAGGLNKGQLEWRRPNQNALHNMLIHPMYAGAYAYGRTCPNKKTRQQQKRPFRVPRGDWLVLLRDRYPAYISWEQYEANQVRLEQNRSRFASRCSVRTGRALLAGLVMCGRCGARLRTQYGGRYNEPRYNCCSRSTLYGDPRCQNLLALPLDEEVVRLTLKALQPAALDVSLQVAADIHKQRDAAEELWRQRLERATYEAERAARQFHAVEPENRLVVRTLEATWEGKLRTQRDLQEQYERFQLDQPKVLTVQEQDRIRCLAADVPALWHAAGTTNADRKAILREVIDRVVVNVEGVSEWVEAKIYWAGGHQSYTRFRRPVLGFSQLSNWPQLLQRIKDLLQARTSASKIAEKLNAEGWRTADSTPFSEACIRMLMLRQGLRSVRNRTRPTESLKKNEWTISDLAKKLQVGYGTLIRWIHEKRVPGRKLDDGRWVVTADKAKCQELTAFLARRDKQRHYYESTSSEATL